MGGGRGRIVALVFSKDRPLQLDATLRSMSEKVTDADIADVRVLFKATTPKFSAGYRRLALEHAAVAFTPEASFKQDLVRLARDSDFLMFLVDDTVFLRTASLAQGVDFLKAVPEAIGFSYRLGRNTTYCYMANRDQRVPEFGAVGSEQLLFRWVDAEDDFGFPLEVSSSLYRTSDLLPLMDELDYDIPNTFESRLADRAPQFAGSMPNLGCYDRSRAVSIPVNLVQTTWKNRSGRMRNLTPARLADRYAAGWRIDLRAWRDLEPNSVHQELELAYFRPPHIPEVSVVSTCPEATGRVIASMSAQTDERWELLIVGESPVGAVAAGSDGASPDPRVRTIRVQTGDVAGMWNAGVAKSRGNQVLLLPDGQLPRADAVATVAGRFAADPHVSVVAARPRPGRALGRLRGRAVSLRALRSGNVVGLSAAIKPEVWDANGGFAEGVPIGAASWDLWLGAIERGYRLSFATTPLLAGPPDASDAWSESHRGWVTSRHPLAYSWRARQRRHVGRAKAVVRALVRTGWEVVRYLVARSRGAVRRTRRFLRRLYGSSRSARS